MHPANSHLLQKKRWEMETEWYQSEWVFSARAGCPERLFALPTRPHTSTNTCHSLPPALIQRRGWVNHTVAWASWESVHVAQPKFPDNKQIFDFFVVFWPLRHSAQKASCRDRHKNKSAQRTQRNATQRNTTKHRIYHSSSAHL